MLDSSHSQKPSPSPAGAAPPEDPRTAWVLHALAAVLLDIARDAVARPPPTGVG